MNNCNENKIITLKLNNVKSIHAFNNNMDLHNIILNEIEHHISLKNIFDNQTIAKDSVDLNINLMKWRMAPSLNTDKIRESKFLIFGAGTLGCHVARGLIGWGVRNITFVDYGKVSFSNPVRQTLYSYKDSVSNNFKAITAAEKLKEIFPLINSQGYVIQIPHPGTRLINDHAKEGFLSCSYEIEELIKDHDYIFLLTDSRESRWLPTVFCSFYNKPCISSAIGFDSYCVIRHGLNEEKKKAACYFCSDISAPMDISKNRTLDQQCTISRPGVSIICSGLAVEMMINICTETFENTPHCLRGNIQTWDMINIDNNAFVK